MVVDGRLYALRGRWDDAAPVVVLIFRFLVGGAVVAAVPVVAAAFGPRLAGVVLLIPAVLTAGLVMLYLDAGRSTAAAGLPGVLLGLVALGVFAGTLWLLTAATGLPFWLALVVSYGAWTLAASTTLLLG